MVADLISIIVPVYNSRDFLRRCLDSIVAQTYRNIEIILVDDGSTDGSGEICDDYAGVDARFRVLHQKNSGASSARNVGLRASSGEWICFADSDDSLHPEMIEYLRHAVSNTAAMAYCEFTDAESGEKFVSYKWESPYIVIRTSDSCLEDLCSPLGSGDARKVFLQGVLWNKIYHRSLLSGISFDESLRSFVDQPFSLEVLLRCDKVAFVGVPLYRYTVRSGSLSHPLREDFSGRYLVSCHKMLNLLPKNRKRCRSLMLSKIYQQMYIERLNVRGKVSDGNHRKLCAGIIKKTAREYFVSPGIPVFEKIRFVSVWFFPDLLVKTRFWLNNIVSCCRRG